jgi:hypothetical protein
MLFCAAHSYINRDLLSIAAKAPGKTFDDKPGAGVHPDLLSWDGLSGASPRKTTYFRPGQSDNRLRKSFILDLESPRI